MIETTKNTTAATADVTLFFAESISKRIHRKLPAGFMLWPNLKRGASPGRLCMQPWDFLKIMIWSWNCRTGSGNIFWIYHSQYLKVLNKSMHLCIVENALLYDPFCAGS